MKQIILCLFTLPFFLGCDKSEENEIMFKAVEKAVSVPNVSDHYPEVKLEYVDNLRLSLKYTSDEFITSSVSLNNPSSDKFTYSPLIIRSKVISILKNKIKGDVSNKEIGFFDSRFYSIGNWKDQFYFPLEEFFKSSSFTGDLSGRMALRLKVSPLWTSQSTRISEIIVGTYFYDREKTSMAKISSQRLIKFEGEDELFNKEDTFLPLFYDLIDEEIHGPYLLAELKKRNNLFLRVDDYLITYENGAMERLSELQSKLDKRFATIVFSGPKKQIVFTTQDSISIKDFMKLQGILLHSNGNGRLVAVNDLVSNLNLPIDWNDLSLDYLKRGKWFLDGIQSVDDKLMVGKKYVIAYASVRQLADRRDRSLNKKLSNGGRVILGSLARNDIIEISLKAQTIKPVFKTEIIPIEYLVAGAKKDFISIAPGHYQRFPVISDDEIGLDCKVYDRKYLTSLNRNFIFVQDQLYKRVTLFLNGVEYPIRDYLFPENKPVLIKDNSVIKFRLRVPQDSEQVSLAIRGNSDQYTEMLGFMGWANCPAKDNSTFVMNNYSREQYPYAYKERLEVEAKLTISTVL